MFSPANFTNFKYTIYTFKPYTVNTQGKDAVTNVLGWKPGHYGRTPADKQMLAVTLKSDLFWVHS